MAKQDELVLAFRVREGGPPIVTPGVEGRITRDIGWFTRKPNQDGKIPYQDAFTEMVKHGTLELQRVPAGNVTVLEDGSKLAEPVREAPFVNLEGVIEDRQKQAALLGTVNVLDETGKPVAETSSVPSLPGFES